MTTTPHVIRDGYDPMIVTTKFDIDHEHDSETGEVRHADITSALYISHGDSAIKLDFGVFGDTSADYLEKEFEAEIEAIRHIQRLLTEAEHYLISEYHAVKNS